jgi:hypothetical protein
LQSVPPDDGVHPNTHLPALHVSPAGQAIPHAPQLPGLDVVSAHIPPQFVSPGPQLAAHFPAEQTWPIAHTVPQAPQFVGSTIGSTHVPLQSWRPA